MFRSRCEYVPKISLCLKRSSVHRRTEKNMIFSLHQTKSCFRKYQSCSQTHNLTQIFRFTHIRKALFARQRQMPTVIAFFHTRVEEKTAQLKSHRAFCDGNQNCPTKVHTSQQPLVWTYRQGKCRWDVFYYAIFHH